MSIDNYIPKWEFNKVVGVFVNENYKNKYNNNILYFKFHQSNHTDTIPRPSLYDIDAWDYCECRLLMKKSHILWKNKYNHKDGKLMTECGLWKNIRINNINE